MSGDTFTFLVGGKAGEGVKKAGGSAANLFASMGRGVFQYDDYPSLIRGGHNFVSVSTATRQITSQYARPDLIVALDARSCETHKGELADGGVAILNSDAVSNGDGVGIPITTEAKKYPNPGLRVGVAGPAALAAAVGLSRDEMEDLISREYKRDLENNIPFAASIYGAVREAIGDRFRLERGDRERPILTGNEAIALGAAAAGLDIYLAYPMSPASTILHFLAKHDRELGVTVMHPESEIAVANMAVGAAVAGARTMVGTSGGGFALMEEALSLAGMAEAPVLCVLASRPGPATGVPTYTEQGDLGFARHYGHGEFPRLVASPGTVGEAFTLAAELLSLVWRFQTPAVLLTERHLSESAMTVDLDVDAAAWAEPVVQDGGDAGGYLRYRDTADGVSPMLFPPSEELIKWTSYEHDETGITTEDGAAIVRMHDKRSRKREALLEHLKGARTVNRFGSGRTIIFTYGSTTMSVLEAVAAGGIDATVVQPVYLEPFPTWELAEYAGTRPIVVEQSAAGQFATLLAEKARVDASAVVKRYDGRPFDPLELAGAIRRAIR